MSVLPTPGLSTPERKGLEALAIALHRQAHGASPRLNFGRMPQGYRMSSANKAGLVRRGRRARGGPSTACDLSHAAGLPPKGPLGGDVHEPRWLGLAWSEWMPLGAAADQAAGSLGLYSIRRRGEPLLAYVGKGRIADRLLAHQAKAMSLGHPQQEHFRDPDGQRIEAALFGREGMAGTAVVLGDDRSPHEVLIQVPGAGHRIAADTLREAMAREPAIRDRFLLYAHAFAIQTAHTVLANGRFTLQPRLARWLLMCHDRIDGDQLSLTHEFLSVMLGVRRAGVTIAVQELEGRGYIKANRGRIHILVRGGLEDLAYGLYGVPEAEYARLMGDRVSRS